jgi:hypothetical protein
VKKHRGKGKKQRGRLKPDNPSGSAATVHAFPSGRNIRVNELGVFGRSYPTKRERHRAIESIKTISEDRRSPQQWWMLGEYLVYDGLLEESDAITNEGIGALMRGANLPEPSVACLLDLAWILAFKGLDQMALPYIERAASKVSESRDIASLKAHIHLGIGDKDGAIAAFETTVSLPVR